MIKNDKQLGTPFIDYTDNKADIEAIQGLVGGETAYSLEGQWGYYNYVTGAWVWITNAGGGGGSLPTLSPDRVVVTDPSGNIVVVNGLRYDTATGALVVGDHASLFGLLGDIEMFAPDGENPAIIKHAFGGTPAIVSFVSGGTEASPSAITDDTVLWQTPVKAWNGSGFVDVGRIRLVANEDHNGTDSGTRWEVLGVVNGTATEVIMLTVDENGINIPTGKTYNINGSPHTHTDPNTLTADRTYYVRTDGNDSNNGLTNSSEGAFLTLTKAANVLKTIYGNGYKVTIQIGSGTFAGAVFENTNGFSSITIKGTKTTLDSITASSGVQGVDGTQGSITRNSGTWTSNQRKDKLIRGTSGNNNGIIRLIESNTTSLATICGIWNGTISNGDTFVIEDWATNVQNLQIIGGNVIIEDIKLTTLVTITTGHNVLLFSKDQTLVLNSCWLLLPSSSTSFYINNSDVTINHSLVQGTGSSGDIGVLLEMAGKLLVRYSRITQPSGTKQGSGLWSLILSAVKIDSGTTLDNWNVGLRIEGSSAGTTFRGSPSSYNRILNNATGISGSGSSSVGFANSSNCTFSGNTTNTSISNTS